MGRRTWSSTSRSSSLSRDRTRCVARAGRGLELDVADWASVEHAVRVLAQCLHTELQSTDAEVGVSVLLPGPVRTRIVADAATTGDEAGARYRRSMSELYTHRERARELVSAHLHDLRAGLD